MTPFFRALCSALLLTVTVAAQTPVEASASADPTAAYEASLDLRPVLFDDEPFTVTLTLEIKQATKVPQTVLSGTNLIFEDGTNEIGSVVDRREGAIELAVGTRLERRMEIDPKVVLADVKRDIYRNLRVSWPGLNGAVAPLALVPDQKDLDLETLDMAKTTVRLITVEGEIVVGFRPDKAPNTVDNFVKLSKNGFYNGTRFHRVISGFMIQGGCPNTREGATGRPGAGSPGYYIDAEFNDIKHVKGIISMARSRSVNSAGSQFFLMHGAQPGLDNAYTAFGQIEQGLDVLDRLAKARTTLQPGGGERSKPIEDLWIYAAVVQPVKKKD